jgi:hypothetical protein
LTGRIGHILDRRTDLMISLIVFAIRYVVAKVRRRPTPFLTFAGRPVTKYGKAAVAGSIPTAPVRNTSWSAPDPDHEVHGCTRDRCPMTATMWIDFKAGRQHFCDAHADLAVMARTMEMTAGD